MNLDTEKIKIIWIINPLAFNPAGSTHVYFQISRTYDSSTDDRQPRETWCMQWEMIQNGV
jgi:hypothetical protein